MSKKSRLRPIILIVLGLILVCGMVCLVQFFLLGGMAFFSPNRVSVSTVAQEQTPTTPVNISVTSLVEELTTEAPSSQATFTFQRLPSVTPLPATSTPELPDGAACVPANLRERALVVEVPDGSSLKVVRHEQPFTIRYVGMRAPYFGLKSEPFGPEAAIFNKSMVQNQIITMVQDVTDQNQSYELPRYVFAGNRFVNYELVRLGYAEAVSAPPDTSCDAVLLQAQNSAQKERLGMWKDFVPTVPVTMMPSADLTASPTVTVVAGPCECKGPDLDCVDFTTRTDAQTCYDYCKSLGLGDIFLIDVDQDGIACINKRP
jgi:micrococcal nuclease